MPISTPQRYTTGDFTFEISGRVGKARTRIRPLQVGRYANILRDNPEIWTEAAQNLANILRRNIPVDTGRLRNSVRVERYGRNVFVTLGPDNRYYALPANRTSRRAGYIEKSLNQISRQMSEAARSVRSTEELQDELSGQMRRIR